MSESPDSPDITIRTKRLRRLTHGRVGWSVARFGTPLVLGMVLHTAFNLVDMLMISRLENASAALAALGMCDMVAAIATILANGISTATVALVSRASGRRHLTAIRRSTWQSLLLLGWMSVAFGALGIFGSDFVVRDLMAAKGETADLAVDYLEVMLGGCFSIFFLLQLTSILRALGHAKTAAALLIGGNVLNIVLNVFLIYGTGPHPPILAWAAPIADALEVPRLGVVGAAWATLIGRSVPVLLGFALLFARRGGPKFHPAYLRPLRAEMERIVRIGWPSSAQLVVRILSILVIVGLINSNFTSVADQSTLAAYSICLRLETFVIFVGMGWGAAASTLVGTNLGAGLPRRAASIGWVAAFWNLGLALGLAALYLEYADVIVGFFDPTTDVVAAGTEYLDAVALTYGPLGVGLVLSQAMTGAGATKPSLVIDLVVVCLLMMPAAVMVTHGLEMPRTALWRVIAASNAISALAFMIYYARGSFLRTAIP